MAKVQKKRIEDEEALMHDHLRRVGCKTIEQYQEWCKQNRLKSSLRKGRIERQRETELYDSLRHQAALQSARQFSRHPEAVLTAISKGETAGLNIHLRGHLALLESLFDSVRKEPRTRDAFLRLLLSTTRISGFQTTENVLHRGGGGANTFAGGLLALARHHAYWKQPPEEWKPNGHNARRQFSDLARYLLCHYAVPTFQEAAWFRGNDPTARTQQGWYIAIGNGASLRSLSLPLQLTKKMAHIALTQVPGYCTVEEGWRWAQVLGMGGTERLARAVIASPLGTVFQEEEFWETVIRFLVDNPMLDISQVGPLIDYLRYERYNPRRANDRNRLPINFTMKGRTAAALLVRMQEWHRETVKASRITTDRWESSGIPMYEYEEERLSGDVHWTIQEITTAKGLIEEGKDMSHCIATYAYSCARRAVSVWSLQAQRPNALEPERVMTIAVSKDGVMTEVRGRRNALPGMRRDFYGVRLGAAEADLLTRGCHILRMWAQLAQLVQPHYLRLDV